MHGAPYRPTIQNDLKELRKLRSSGLNFVDEIQSDVLSAARYLHQILPSDVEMFRMIQSHSGLPLSNVGFLFVYVGAQVDVKPNWWIEVEQQADRVRRRRATEVVRR